MGGLKKKTKTKTNRDGGTMVTYGGMSKKPLTIPTGSLIFKDQIFKGFWMTRWTQENSREKREEMLTELCNWAKAGLFKVDVVKVPFADFKQAVAESTKPFKSGKQLLVM
jgi:trans-2-enoyl-CoA reductase